MISNRCRLPAAESQAIPPMSLSCESLRRGTMPRDAYGTNTKQIHFCSRGPENKARMWFALADMEPVSACAAETCGGVPGNCGGGKIVQVAAFSDKIIGSTCVESSQRDQAWSPFFVSL